MTFGLVLQQLTLVLWGVIAIAVFWPNYGANQPIGDISQYSVCKSTAAIVTIPIIDHPKGQQNLLSAIEVTWTAVCTSVQTFWYENVWTVAADDMLVVVVNFLSEDSIFFDNYRSYLKEELVAEHTELSD